MLLKNLNPSDFQNLSPYFENQKHELCVYSLSSIIVWEDDFTTPQFNETDGVLTIAVTFKNDIEEDHLIIPVSPQKIHTPEMLNQLSLSTGIDVFWFVPELYLEEFGTDEIEKWFTIEKHTEYTDYVYLTEDIGHLKGKKFSKKRNLINQFQKIYVDTGRVEIREITNDDALECTKFLDEWCKERDCSYDNNIELACEKQAAVNALNSIEILGFRGILLKIDDVISAFGIGSQITDDMWCLHFEKAFSHVKGLYQYFDSECAKRLFPDVKYLNKESDMGSPGLEKAKKSYFPVKMLNSYRLIAKK
jgi:hypothetical protein